MNLPGVSEITDGLKTLNAQIAELLEQVVLVNKTLVRIEKQNAERWEERKKLLSRRLKK